MPIAPPKLRSSPVLLRSLPFVRQPRSSDSTVDVAAAGSGGGLSPGGCQAGGNRTGVESSSSSVSLPQHQALAIDAFRTRERAPASSPTLEHLWTIQRCDAFDEGDDSDSDEDQHHVCHDYIHEYQPAMHHLYYQDTDEEVEEGQEAIYCTER